MSDNGKIFKNIRPISYREFLRREYNIVHAPYENEVNFYSVIAAGNIRKLAGLGQKKFSELEGLGILSENYLQNLRYHFVITTASIARACIDAGLPFTEAYDMSDYYIRLMDSAANADEIDSLHTRMCLSYARRMQKLHKESICSKPVVACIDYIYDHLDTRITMDDLTHVSGLSSSYISRLFKKETGFTVSRYILVKKLTTAQNMLLYSDYSIAEISAALSFPNQSYFTNVFRKEFSMTPGQFRNAHPMKF